MTKQEKSQAATGSMFVTEAYLPAKLSDNNNTVLARYNAYSDFFEINTPQEGKVQTVTKDPSVTITFVGTKKTYAYVNYKTGKGDAESGYLNVLAAGPKAKFYKRERIILQPEVFPNNSYQTYKPASYKKADDEFYVSLNNGETVILENKKDLAKLAPSKSKEILDYIKTNKIDLEKEQDLVKLGQYLETIL